MQSRTNKKQALHGKFLGSKQGLRRSTKSCTRKEHESATNSIAKRGQGGNSPLQGQGTASLVGFGATPQLLVGALNSKEEVNKRRRQRSVPASNFARPQTRPQAALPPRVREEPKNRLPVWDSPLKDYTISRMEKAQADGAGESGNSITPCSTRSSAFQVHPAPFRRLPDFRRARRGTPSISAPCRRGGR